MDAPQYIRPEYLELFKELKPEDLNLPSWVRFSLQGQYACNETELLIRKAIIHAISVADVVPTDSEFPDKLRQRKQVAINARSDLVSVLKAIQAKKAIPFEEQFQIELLPQRCQFSS